MDAIQKLLDSMEPSDWQWMKENWEGKREQCFTHHEKDTGIVRHIHATKLWQGIKAGHVDASPRMMAITDDLYKTICTSQGIERDHLANITPDSAVYDPALVIVFTHGDKEEHIIIDGNHKLVKSYEMGLRRHPAMFVLSSELEPYLVHPPAKVSQLMVLWTEANTPHLRY